MQQRWQRRHNGASCKAESLSLYAAGNGSVADTPPAYSEDGDVAAAARALQDLESQDPLPVAANGRRGAKVQHKC